MKSLLSSALGIVTGLLVSEGALELIRPSNETPVFANVAMQSSTQQANYQHRDPDNMTLEPGNAVKRWGQTSELDHASNADAKFVAVFKHKLQGITCMEDYSGRPVMFGPPTQFDLYLNGEGYQYLASYRMQDKQCHSLTTNAKPLTFDEFFPPAKQIWIEELQSWAALSWFKVQENA